MEISQEQLDKLKTLTCERLSSNEENLYLVDSFMNARNEALSDVLKNKANEEDEKNLLAYYVVKDSKHNILFYFSLKCGMLYDRFIDGENLRNIVDFYKFLSNLINSSDIDETQKKSIEEIQEQIRTKKVLKKSQVLEKLKGEVAKAEIDKLFGDDEQKTVGKTFSGIEIVHFCANDGYRAQWDKLGLGKKMGAVVFWQFIVPKIQDVLKIIGCEYVFLFAADLTPDEHLVNYYRTYMQFDESPEHGAAVPLYDLTCKMMCRKTKSLQNDKDEFFSHFNPDDDEI
jgi:hypothetical protein